MTKGYSVIELTIAIAIGAIVVGAVVLFVGRGFGISRTTFEQAHITEDARNLLERISDSIRNARVVPPDTVWADIQWPYEISFYSNVDADPDTEKVRYFLQQATLYRGVIQPVVGTYPGDQEEVTAVAKSVRNFEQGVPMFVYYVNNQGGLSVDVTLLVDANIFQYPPYAVVHTLVTPRGGSTP